jgi:TATA-box binding protein (TBP) (component of TFIID and TFIIIB)
MAAKNQVVQPSATTFTITPLRISTMTVTANWGMPIQRDSLFRQLKALLIPIGYPGIGILKLEHNSEVFGACYKDLFTNRKATPKSFFNQSTIVLRRPTASGWKELNMKIFGNGGIQMTGVTSKEFAVEGVEWLLAQIKQLAESPFQDTTKEPAVTKVDVSLINTDYSLNKDIQQDNLHKILMEQYNLFSMLEKTIYQGVNTKFFYNTNNGGSGICKCKGFCKGQGLGDGEGECKRITMSIFRTGKIIITGARTMDQIEAAYVFLNKVFRAHAQTVLVGGGHQV